VSTSQRVNKKGTKLEFFYFFLMMLYSSFVMNTLEKFPGAATCDGLEISLQVLMGI
jgi:hypothetical protein